MDLGFLNLAVERLQNKIPERALQGHTLGQIGSVSGGVSSLEDLGSCVARVLTPIIFELPHHIQNLAQVQAKNRFLGSTVENSRYHAWLRCVDLRRFS